LCFEGKFMLKVEVTMRTSNSHTLRCHLRKRERKTSERSEIADSFQLLHSDFNNNILQSIQRQPQGENRPGLYNRFLTEISIVSITWSM